jgi:hypothetical protein
MVNRPDNSFYYSPDPKMSTAQRRTPHRKPIFAKPLIDNYLREIGEIGLDKRRRIHPLPAGTFHLDEKSSRTCVLLQIPPRNNEMPVVYVAGFTATWNSQHTSACHGRRLHSTSTSRLCVQLVSRKLARTLFATKPMMHPEHVPGKSAFLRPPMPAPQPCRLALLAQRSGNRNQESQNSHLTLTENPLPYGCG